ncbi:MAG TPA: hypothetical protein VFH06_01610 [Candidatus Saccharimonadales bacterium]|nr:hypothetical protein [Candidatus Saccharimonadales bacterium]
MAEQRFVPGTPIDPSVPLIVGVFHEEWLRVVYPEIKEVATSQRTWEGKTFIVYPVHEYGVTRKLLKMLMATTNEETAAAKNYPHPIHDEKGRLIAVVVHQVSSMIYDGLYTYRMLMK